MPIPGASTSGQVHGLEEAGWANQKSGGGGCAEYGGAVQILSHQLAR